MNSSKIPEQDLRLMELAVLESEKHWGLTRPNPSVGTVIARDGRIIASAVTAAGGRPHSETMALDKAAAGAARGADMYVTLEPCSHTGHTRPCVDAIISSGIGRVFIGCKDPNPLVNGSGIRMLRRAGVKVVTDVLADRCAAPNEWFFKSFRSDMPYVTVKSAVTLDGKIATVDGDSKWLSGPEALEFAHLLRRRADAVIVGRDTILADNPSLDARIKGVKKVPDRVVLDSDGTLPAGLKIFRRHGAERVFYFSSRPHRKDLGRFSHVIPVEVDVKPKALMDLKEVLRYLRKDGVMSLLCEGGGRLNASFLEEGLADRVIAVITPRLIGGSKAPTFFDGHGFRTISRSVILRNVDFHAMGRDLVYSGYIHTYH